MLLHALVTITLIWSSLICWHHRTRDRPGQARGALQNGHVEDWPQARPQMGPSGHPRGWWGKMRDIILLLLGGNWLPWILYFPINIGLLSSSQMTKSYFSEGFKQPPTRLSFLMGLWELEWWWWYIKNHYDNRCDIAYIKKIWLNHGIHDLFAFSYVYYLIECIIMMTAMIVLITICCDFYLFLLDIWMHLLSCFFFLHYYFVWWWPIKSYTQNVYQTDCQIEGLTRCQLECQNMFG